MHDIPYERNRVLAELTAPGAKSYIMPSVEVKTVVRKLTVRLRSFLGVFAIGGRNHDVHDCVFDGEFVQSVLAVSWLAEMGTSSPFMIACSSV